MVQHRTRSTMDPPDDELIATRYIAEGREDLYVLYSSQWEYESCMREKHVNLYLEEDPPCMPPEYKKTLRLYKGEDTKCLKIYIFAHSM